MLLSYAAATALLTVKRTTTMHYSQYLHPRSAAFKRARRQAVCGAASLAGSAIAVIMFLAFAYVHDTAPETANALAAQAALLGGCAASVVLAFVAILVGLE
jgi:hypothetical protein